MADDHAPSPNFFVDATVVTVLDNSNKQGHSFDNLQVLTTSFTKMILFSFLSAF